MSDYGKIMLVEDDVSLAQWVQEYLTEQGFSVEHIEQGDEAVKQFSQIKPDLILLDVMLPVMDGVEVCRHIRKDSKVPIIMMTAKGDEFDEVIGLEVGADDYIIKPVRPRALLARIKATLRFREPGEENQPASNHLSFGDLSLDFDAKRALFRGEEIILSTNEFALMWYLAANAGQVLDRDTVFRELKGREYDGLDRRFDMMVSTLRKKFYDDPQNPQKIKTIWGKGYLFVADAWN